MARRYAKAPRPRSAAMIVTSRCVDATSSSVQPRHDKVPSSIGLSRSKSVMIRSLLVIPVLAFASGAALAQTPPPAYGKPASIPFVDMRGIEDFQADGDHAIYLQDRSRK